MKKQKLTLDELKVQSFVTELSQQERQTWDVKGGSSMVSVENLCMNPDIIISPNNPDIAV